MPRKIRELISELRKAGFVLDRQKGSHRQFKHPSFQVMESNKSLSRIAVSALPQIAMTGLPCLRASRAMPILRFHPPHAGGLGHFHDRERSVCSLCQQIPYFWRMNFLLVVARYPGRVMRIGTTMRSNVS